MTVQAQVLWYCTQSANEVHTGKLLLALFDAVQWHSQNDVQQQWWRKLASGGLNYSAPNDIHSLFTDGGGGGGGEST